VRRFGDREEDWGATLATADKARPIVHSTSETLVFLWVIKLFRTRTPACASNHRNAKRTMAGWRTGRLASGEQPDTRGGRRLM
jgi:hypothetical protein